MSAVKTGIPSSGVFVRMGAMFALCVIAGVAAGCGIAATGNGGGPETRITKFVINKTEGVIDQERKTISVVLPAGTNLQGLSAQVEFSGAELKPASGEPQNFSKSVIYTVYSKDGSMFAYTVTVTLEIPNTKEIIAFSLSGAAGTITEQGENAGTIKVTVPYGTDLSNRTVSIGHNGAWIDPQPGSPQNFNNPVTYTVVSGKNNKRIYTVIAAIAESNQHDIISFKIGNALGVIAGTSITVTIPFDTRLAALVPEIKLSTGAQVDPPSGKMMDFSKPVSYKATSASGSETKTYTVTVKTAAKTDKSIENFMITGQKSSAITEIDAASGAILVTLPSNMPVTNLVPLITFSGNTVDPASGKTNDFTNTQIYTVTASDGTIKRYTVTMAHAPVKSVSLDDVTSNGKSFETATTTLVLTFSTDMGTALEAKHIGLATLGTITKGTLDRLGSGVYLLNVSNIPSNNAPVTVSITDQPYGYIISGSKQVNVYKEPTQVIWSALVQDGGVDGSTTTTGLKFTFDKEITGLAASDMTLTGAVKDALSGSGKTYTLLVNGISANNAIVTVDLPKTSTGAYTFAPPTMSAIVYKKKIIEPNMTAITGAVFMMGSPASEASRHSDETQHQVTLRPFVIGNLLVTQKRWKEIMGNNPSYFKGDDLPVEKVSWVDAVTFCNKLSEAQGLDKAYTINGTNVTWDENANGYRLPTEAEWEYACRAGTTTPYNTGDTLSTAQANFKNDPGRTTPPGTYSPNNWGLYDMHGNLYEWCWDWYGTNYYGTDEAKTNPKGPASGTNRVLRGGSWGDLSADYLRSAIRASTTPSSLLDAGFRVARND